MNREVPERLGRVDVATCIACGARTRLGTCEHGCDDRPLDIVEGAAVDSEVERAAALDRRVVALRGVLDDFASHGAWEESRAHAREALAIAVGPAPARPEVVPAWGCPECGRVDAPQPCLDVCIRRPVEMTDAAEYDEVAARTRELDDLDRRLSGVARMIAHVRARPGGAETTLRELQQRAQDALRSS
jgi:hypothetical protein